MTQVVEDEFNLEAARQRAEELFDSNNTDELSLFFSELHPVELVAVIDSAGQDRQHALLQHITGLDLLSDFVSYAPERLRESIVELLDDSRIAAVVRRQEADDAADFISILPHPRQVRVMRRLSAGRVKEITSLLAWDRDSAGGLMTPLYAAIAPDITCQAAMESLRKDLVEEELSSDVNLSYIFVLDSQERPIGVCSFREILTAGPEELIEEVMTTPVITVAPEDDQEIVARKIADYDLSAIPVVENDTNRILGIVTVDDVVDVIHQEATEDLLKLAGTEDEDIVGASTFTAFRSRMPWLLASWGGGICGAMLLGHFSSILEKIVALAFFMPVVFGMGGNVGSQCSTITVRGLATQSFSKGHLVRRLRKELAVGISLGTTFGLLLYLASYALFQDPHLSAVVGISIATTMTCAAGLGSMLPVFFHQIGIDPAVASGPFVTTTTDILSITIYFSIATSLL